MKRLTLVIALMAAFAAHAQDSNSNAGSNASSSSNPVVSNGSSTSTSNVDASASSQSGTSGNSQGVQVNYYGPGSGLNPDGTPQAGQQNADGTPRDGRDRNGYAVQRVINEGGVNNTNRNINEGESTQRVVYSGTQTVKNVPSIQMSGPASGPCTGVSGGIGISGPGWGVGINGSAVMDDCRLRENTRVLGMAMQAMDGQAYPQERGEVTVMFMDAVRNLSAYNSTIYQRAVKEAK